MCKVGLIEVFAVLYGIAFFVLLGCAFMQMRNGWSGRTQQPVRRQVQTDRTGLKTIHPELLDGNGELIDEDLMTVTFEGYSDGPLTYPGAQPG